MKYRPRGLQAFFQDPLLWAVIQHGTYAALPEIEGCYDVTSVEATADTVFRILHVGRHLVTNTLGGPHVRCIAMFVRSPRERCEKLLAAYAEFTRKRNVSNSFSCLSSQWSRPCCYPGHIHHSFHALLSRFVYFAMDG
jgi:hypothetical protein